jgi:methylenetetrahydrofolate dehydrogenase (NADP+) / methenyltetrahydrofolate cyclohydrolase
MPMAAIYNEPALVFLFPHGEDAHLAGLVLDGKRIATQIETELAEEVADFVQNNATSPTLAAVLVGDDPASAVYVRNKRLACDRVGIESKMYRLPAETGEEELLELIA